MLPSRPIRPSEPIAPEKGEFKRPKSNMGCILLVMLISIIPGIWIALKQKDSGWLYLILGMFALSFFIYWLPTIIANSNDSNSAKETYKSYDERYMQYERDYKQYEIDFENYLSELEKHNKIINSKS